MHPLTHTLHMYTLACTVHSHTAHVHTCMHCTLTVYIPDCLAVLLFIVKFSARPGIMSSKGPELVEEAPRESLDPPPETIRCNRHNEDHDSSVSSDSGTYVLDSERS